MLSPLYQVVQANQRQPIQKFSCQHVFSIAESPDPSRAMRDYLNTALWSPQKQTLQGYVGTSMRKIVILQSIGIIVIKSRETRWSSTSADIPTDNFNPQDSTNRLNQGLNCPNCPLEDLQVQMIALVFYFFYYRDPY